MPSPNVIFKEGAFEEIKAKAPSLDSKREIEQHISERTLGAERMAKKGLDRLNSILSPRKNRDKRKRWRSDPFVMTYFGNIRTVEDIKAVRRRLERAYRRLDKRELNIRLLPQSRASKSSTNGHNIGGPLTPWRFVLFPNWFDRNRGTVQQSAIIIHELLHDWHVDHKVRDGSKRVTAYGERLAKKLARDKPSYARRNPENYEQFCIAVWNS